MKLIDVIFLFNLSSHAKIDLKSTILYENVTLFSQFIRKLPEIAPILRNAKPSFF